MDLIGLGPAHREAHDASLYTLEAHVRYLAEVAARSELEVRSSVIGATGKLLWIWHEMRVGGRLCATEEVLGVHVVGGRSAPFPDDVAARARTACVEPPAEASGRIRPLPAS